MARRSSCPSSICSSILTAISGAFGRGICPFISARSSPDGGGMDTGAVCAADIALVPLPPRREKCGLAPFSWREAGGRFIRAVMARGWSSSSSSSSDRRGRLESGCEASTDGEELREGGFCLGDDGALYMTNGKKEIWVMRNGKLPRGNYEWNLPRDAAGSVSGLASDIFVRIPSRRALTSASE